MRCGQQAAGELRAGRTRVASSPRRTAQAAFAPPVGRYVATSASASCWRLLLGAAAGADRAGLDTIPKTTFARYGFLIVREQDDGYGPGIHGRNMCIRNSSSAVGAYDRRGPTDPPPEGPVRDRGSIRLLDGHVRREFTRGRRRGEGKSRAHRSLRKITRPFPRAATSSWRDFFLHERA